jgi:hypothetical protein
MDGHGSADAPDDLDVVGDVTVRWLARTIHPLFVAAERRADERPSAARERARCVRASCPRFRSTCLPTLCSGPASAETWSGLLNLLGRGEEDLEASRPVSIALVTTWLYGRLDILGID